MNLRDRHETWLNGLRREGIPIVTYQCPHCEGELHALRPPPGNDLWDTFATCVHCERVHFRAVWRNGSIIAEEVLDHG